MSASAQMPQYRSHKKVWALKIASVEDVSVVEEHEGGGMGGHSEVLLSFENKTFAPVQVDARNRPQPATGWYYIVYPDGYQSFSPAEAFESGYSLV